MRKGFDGLALLVQEKLKHDQWRAPVRVPRPARRTAQSTMARRRTPAQLGYLLEGIDWRAPQHTWRPQAAG